MFPSKVRTAEGWGNKLYYTHGARLKGIKKMIRNSKVCKNKTRETEHYYKMPCCSPRACLLWKISAFWQEHMLV